MQEYTVRRSRRALHLRLSVQPGGAVILTAPIRCSEGVIERFIYKNQSWIVGAQEKMRHLTPLPKSSRRAYLRDRESLRSLVHERLTYWNAFYRFSYGRVAIKNTRTLWGSCSRKGNLNFSYALMHLPREIVDYIVVHELCHLKEHNHSEAFWNLVGSTIPQYKALRKRLRLYARSA